MSARQRGSSGSNSAAGAAPAVASSSSAASFFTRLQHAVSPSLHPIPILPRLEWSKSINPANPLDVIRGAQLLNVKAAGGAAAAAAASDEAAPLTALQQAQALQARSKWLESPPPAPVTAAGPAASSSVAASAAPSSQPAAASSQPNSQRPQSTQQSQPGANSRMRRSLESATAKPLHYSGAAVAGFTSSRQRNKAAASFDRRTSLRSCIDLTSPEPIDEPSSDDDDEEDDGMSDGEQPQHTIGRAAAPSAAVAAAAAPVATVAMDEEPRLAAPVATPAAISTRWQWQTLLPTTLSQSIAAPASHSLASAPQRNAAAPSSSSQAAAAPPQNTIRELHQANGSSSVPVTILSLMASNPPLPFKASRPTARLATLAAPSKPVPSLHSWQKASKLFAPIKDDDTDDFIPNSDASPIPVSPPRSSVTKRVVAPSVQRAASFSSSSASVSHASPISTDGASTSDEEVDDEDEDDERGSESTGGCPLPWCNDLTGSPPPRYKHLTHNNEESAGYKALPRLISKGCKCHSRGMNCSLSTCACMRMGTAGYNKEGLLVAQETRKSNIVYECNSQCGCGPECMNRVLQHYPSFNPKLGLQLFMTRATSWGVRSTTGARGGLLIDEYMGVRKTLQEVMELEEDDDSTGYMFDCDTDALHEQDYRAKQFLSQVSKLGFRSIKHALEKWPRVTVDARDSGSIARFINHSVRLIHRAGCSERLRPVISHPVCLLALAQCSPNVQAVQVFTEDRSPHAAHVVYFTLRDIPPKEEFVVDYNYDQRNVWAFVCQCGSKNCKNPPAKQRVRNQK